MMKITNNTIAILTGLTLLSSSPVNALTPIQQEKLTQINHKLEDSQTVYKARILADKIENQELLYNTTLAFVNSGNPSNAVYYANKLTNPEWKFDIAKTIIERGNPMNGRWILRRMPEEYQLKGVELLIKSGNPKNAEELKTNIDYNRRNTLY